MSEHDQQVTVFDWAYVQSRSVPELALLFAIPNGGGRGKSYVNKVGRKLPPLLAVKLKKEGLKSGVPDIFLPVSRNDWHGLFIELKDENQKGSMLSDNQLKWRKKLIGQGYKTITCWSATEAINELKDYLGIRR